MALPKRSRRSIHTIAQMRAELRRKVRESGMSQAAFARDKLNDSPEALSLMLNPGPKRGLSRKAQEYLGVRRVIMYQTK